MKSSMLAVVLGLGVAVSGLPAWAQTDPITAAQPALKKQALTITSANGTRHPFTVEIAATPREQEIGLMFRTDIPADTGMLFVWPQPQQQQMWMKNCPVPEDMVFIGPDNRILHIAENTVPYSMANVDSGGIAKATLELQGGLTAKLGIGVGDLVTNDTLGAPNKS